MAHRDTLAVAEQKDNEERRKSNSAGGRRKKGWGSKKRGIQHEHERRREAGRREEAGEREGGRGRRWKGQESGQRDNNKTRYLVRGRSYC